MKNLRIIILVLLTTNCAVDRSINIISETEQQTLKTFQNFKPEHSVQLTEDNEPGEKLLLCITFINRDTKKGIANQQVHFYHTNTNGEYKPTNPNDETTARINGTTNTNNYGQVFVKTILPGDYGNSENNRHIHTTVFKEKPKNYDIFFNQYSGGFGKLMNSGNNQMFYANLKKTEDNTLVSFVTIEAKEPVTKNNSKNNQ